jgi:hypothetical protein
MAATHSHLGSRELIGFQSIGTNFGGTRCDTRHKDPLNGVCKFMIKVTYTKDILCLLAFFTPYNLVSFITHLISNQIKRLVYIQ